MQTAVPIKQTLKEEKDDKPLKSAVFLLLGLEERSFLGSLVESTPNLIGFTIENVLV